MQVPFSVSGVSPTRVRVQSARWELGHNFPLTCGTARGCPGSGSPVTAKYVVWVNPADRGGYLALQVAGDAGALTGTLQFGASAHDRTLDVPDLAEPLGDDLSVTFGAVLVLDLQDSATGQILTVRSQAITVTAN